LLRRQSGANREDEKAEEKFKKNSFHQKFVKYKSCTIPIGKYTLIDLSEIEPEERKEEVKAVILF
jgi:hypothetical protein